MRIHKTAQWGRERTPVVLLFACFGLSSLYDFYVGVRLFDIAALLLMFALIVRSFGGMADRGRLLSLPSVRFADLVAPYVPALLFASFSVYGALSFGQSSSLMSLIFLLLCLWLVRLPLDVSRALVRLVPFLIVAHLIFFVAQLGFYYGFAYVVDYLSLAREALFNSPLHGFLPDSWLNMPSSRIVTIATGGMEKIFRPAGLFQEPNNYCETMLLLVLMMLRDDRMPFLRYAVYATMILSQSMYGIGIALGLFVFDVALNKRPHHFVAALFGVGLFFVIRLCMGFDGPIDFMVRARHILYDSSFVERYVGLQKGASLGLVPAVSVTDHCALPDLPFRIFGYGLSSAYFEYCTAKNGIAQLIYATGAFAPIVLAFLWRSLRLSLALRDAWILSIGVFLMLLSYPFYSYMFFWCWLGIVLSAGRERPVAAAEQASGKRAF